MNCDSGSATELGISDEELAELALAADPDAPLAPDAVPIDLQVLQMFPLPLWYMPPVARSGVGRWRRPIVLAVIAAFLLTDALGLCNTYGVLTL